MDGIGHVDEDCMGDPFLLRVLWSFGPASEWCKVGFRSLERFEMIGLTQGADTSGSFSPLLFVPSLSRHLMMPLFRCLRNGAAVRFQEV